MQLGSAVLRLLETENNKPAPETAVLRLGRIERRA
jgi:hypothetical protein